MEVSATVPPLGEQTVWFKIHTDSLLTPTIPLSLRVVSKGTPPFVLRAEGDVTFHSDIDPEETRELIVHTIERQSESERLSVQCDIDCVKWKLIKVDKEPYIDDGSYHLTYQYRVSLVAPIPSGVISGTLTVIDPWDKTRIHKVPVFAWNRKNTPIPTE